MMMITKKKNMILIRMKKLIRIINKTKIRMKRKKKADILFMAILIRKKEKKRLKRINVKRGRKKYQNILKKLLRIKINEIYCLIL